MPEPIVGATSKLTNALGRIVSAQEWGITGRGHDDTASTQIALNDLKIAFPSGSQLWLPKSHDFYGFSNEIIISTHGVGIVGDGRNSTQLRFSPALHGRKLLRFGLKPDAINPPVGNELSFPLISNLTINGTGDNYHKTGMSLVDIEEGLVSGVQVSNWSCLSFGQCDTVIAFGVSYVNWTSSDPSSAHPKFATVLGRLNVHTAGAAYVVGDLFSIAGGTGGIGEVTSVSAGGVTGTRIINAGTTGYLTSSNVATTALTGVGVGLTVDTKTLWEDYFILINHVPGVNNGTAYQILQVVSDIQLIVRDLIGPRLGAVKIPALTDVPWSIDTAVGLETAGRQMTRFTDLILYAGLPISIQQNPHIGGSGPTSGYLSADFFNFEHCLTAAHLSQPNIHIHDGAYISGLTFNHMSGNLGSYHLFWRDSLTSAIGYNFKFIDSRWEQSLNQAGYMVCISLTNEGLVGTTLEGLICGNLADCNGFYIHGLLEGSLANCFFGGSPVGSMPTITPIGLHTDGFISVRDCMFNTGLIFGPEFSSSWINNDVTGAFLGYGRIGVRTMDVSQDAQVNIFDPTTATLRLSSESNTLGYIDFTPYAASVMYDPTLIATSRIRADRDTNNHAGKLSFWTTDIAGALSSKMAIDHNGYVGIGSGIATLGAPLDVFDYSGATNPSIRLTSAANTLGQIDFYSSGGTNVNARIQVGLDGSNIAGKFSIFTSLIGTGVLAERLTIKNDGKIGIANTNPSEILDVTGNIKNSGVMNAGTGFQIGGTAPSGHSPVGNGTSYVDTDLSGVFFPIAGNTTVIGYIDTNTGYRVSGAAPLHNALIGDGTNFVATVITHNHGLNLGTTSFVGAVTGAT